MSEQEHFVSVADKAVFPKSTALEGVRIAYAVCGGIGAVESVRFVRELRRHGAEVVGFLTPAAIKFLPVMPLEWATGRPVVCEEGPAMEHFDPFNLVIVAPATMNTIAKAALGMADNVVTLLLTTQLGQKGMVLFVPTMNEKLLAHPRYPEHRAMLEKWGARFFDSKIEEGRLKMPDVITFGNWVICEWK